MSDVEGARSFRASGDAYDRFMGRYSQQLAAPFADSAGVAAGQRVLDVGCGPGALTGQLVERVGAGAVHAIDPSPQFVATCAERHPGAAVQSGQAESIPFADASFDRVLAQLVFHFMSDPALAASEMRRVLRPGGIATGCVWNLDGGMEMLSRFWEAARRADERAPGEQSGVRFGRSGEIAAVFRSAGFAEVDEVVLEVSSTYGDFDELWAGFLAGIGPAGAYTVGLPDERRERVRLAYFDELGSPSGPITLRARATSATARR